MQMASSRILLVEDDRDQASLFSSVLEIAGDEVETVFDAETAVTRLHQEKFDLLLADWDLPVMKGDELILHVKLQYPHVKTILFSNHDDVDLAAQSSGADAWMHKIDGIKKLRELVAEQLQPVSDATGSVK